MYELHLHLCLSGPRPAAGPSLPSTRTEPRWGQNQAQKEATKMKTPHRACEIPAAEACSLSWPRSMGLRR